MSSITTIYDFILPLLNIIISWQVSALVIVLILRKPITELFSRVIHLKHNETEFSFTKSVNKFNKQTEKIQLKDTTKLEEASLFMKRVYSIAEISPVSVIIFAYFQIENTFTNDFEVVDDKFREKIINELSLSLYNGNLITKQKYDLFGEMTNIYNTVLNNKSVALNIKKKTAIKYGKSANKLINKINELRY